jgi:hypothetical protein
MVDMSSPNDPVFWLHHCNIDRLWAEWQRQHLNEEAYLPEDGAPTGQNLNEPMIFNLPGERAPWPDQFTPAEVLDHRTMGVRYDTEPEERMARKTKPATRERKSLPMFVIPSEIPALSGKKAAKRTGKATSQGKHPPKKRKKETKRRRH